MTTNHNIFRDKKEDKLEIVEKRNFNHHQLPDFQMMHPNLFYAPIFPFWSNESMPTNFWNYNTRARMMLPISVSKILEKAQDSATATCSCEENIGKICWRSLMISI